MLDPEGRFDASNGGDIRWLYWNVGREVVALKQLKARYYERGLLAKIMGFNKEPLRKVGPFEPLKEIGELAAPLLPEKNQP